MSNTFCNIWLKPRSVCDLVDEALFIFLRQYIEYCLGNFNFIKMSCSHQNGFSKLVPLFKSGWAHQKKRNGFRSLKNIETYGVRLSYKDVATENIDLPLSVLSSHVLAA
jgi:hypothetical protein